MLDVSLIHKLFNQTVMGKQAFVKAYACFQTTASLQGGYSDIFIHT